MKYQWLKRADATQKSQVLVFFLGWGQRPDGWLDLAQSQSCDVLAVYDYEDSACDWIAQLVSYERHYLAAWSLGVWQAAQIIWPWSWTGALAINGTLEPISALYGIAPEVFAGTLEKWQGVESLRRFERRMGIKRSPEYLELRDPDKLQRELQSLYERILSSESKNCRNIYDEVWIGSLDKIFPAAQQLAAWEREDVRIIQYPLWPHTPEGRINNWDELLVEKS